MTLLPDSDLDFRAGISIIEDADDFVFWLRALGKAVARHPERWTHDRLSLVLLVLAAAVDTANADDGIELVEGDTADEWQGLAEELLESVAPREGGEGGASPGKREGTGAVPYRARRASSQRRCSDGPQGDVCVVPAGVLEDGLG